MKITRLATGLLVFAWLSACAVQRSAESTAPAASAAPTTPTAAAEDQAAESPVATPPPAPAAAPQGLDQPKSKAEDEPEFSSLEAAERALNQAKADLDRLALAEPAPSVGRDAALDRTTEKKASKSGARAPSAAGAAATKSTAPCEDTCRAFSSLTRAAHAVCRLDGNGGTHCNRAKHVLADAQQRVASCSCQAASD